MTDWNKIENALSGIISDAINGMTHEQLMELVMPCGDSISIET